MSAKNNKPRALVIGGSLGGLCDGVCLRAVGWPVSIFERSPGLMGVQSFVEHLSARSTSKGLSG